MSKMVKSVEITFENLDYVEIPAEYFGKFQISGICTTAERLACNAILKQSKAEQVAFELLRSVDIALPGLMRDLFYDPMVEFSLLERIKDRRDITHLELHYDDCTAERFCVPWEDAEDEYHNKLQQANINNNGNLTVKLEAANENASYK